MKDKLCTRYRNISGTILVINDLNYLEIGINEVIDISLFSDNLINKSVGLREHIALKNLIPDESGVEAQQIDLNFLKKGSSFNNSFIKQVAQEIKETIKFPFEEIGQDIKSLAKEIGKEISANIQNQQISDENIKVIIEKLINSKNNIAIDENNEYEKNIIDSNINRMQEALEKKYPSTSQNLTMISEEKLDGNDELISDLRDMLNKKGD